MDIRELHTDHEIAEAFALMSTLRDRIKGESFLHEVRRQQVEGYRLFAGFEGGRLLVLAGVRRTHTLSRGEHLFVDDLVTAEDAQGRAYGATMVRWLAKQAHDQGLTRIYLDSRATAKGFYERLGFTFLTATPCWIDVTKIPRE